MKRLTLSALVLSLSACAVPVFAEASMPDLNCIANVRGVGEQMPKMFQFRTIVDFYDYQYVNGREVYTTEPQDNQNDVEMIISPDTGRGTVQVTFNGETVAYGNVKCR